MSKFCGEDDIITPITPADEVIRRNRGYRGPQNYLAPLSDYEWGDYKKLLLLRGKKKRYYNHIPAAEVKDHVGDTVWNNYFKFCFERNPWDRLISYYFWKNQSEPRPTISEFLESGAPNILKKRGFRCYTIDGQVAVDKVCLFERLEEELESIRVRLNLPEKLDLPRAKSSFRKDKRSLREILSDGEGKKIGELFSEEIALFGYEY
jgi:hypothetical protein